MSKWYILKGDEIVPSDLMEYSKWYASRDTVIAQTNIGDAHISTVFLGLDHGMGTAVDGEFLPVLFETMIFGGKHDQLQTRYHTLEEARLGHEALVNKLKRYEKTGYDQ